jgi:hypothetical protein
MCVQLTAAVVDLMYSRLFKSFLTKSDVKH